MRSVVPFPASPVSPSSYSCLRHVLSTSLRLESAFWVAIDRLAGDRGLSWREWVTSELADKPAYANASSWLRVRCLLQSCRGNNHG